MLERSDQIGIANGLSLPVDIIGLKVQATVNNPGQSASDWSDIRIILESAADRNIKLDWLLLQSYLEIFDLTEKLKEMKLWYGKAN